MNGISLRLVARAESGVGGRHQLQELDLLPRVDTVTQTAIKLTRPMGSPPLRFSCEPLIA